MGRYRISGVPVVETLEINKWLVFNKPDPALFLITINQSQTIWLSENLVTAPVGTDLATAESILQEHRIENFLVDEEGRLSVDYY